ncbi:MAG: DMT family transporter [Actinomycetia bacterium]|nr:DMT family transporter [Actinomycetes bacterium]
MIQVVIVVVFALLHAIFQSLGDVLRHRDLARLKGSAKGQKIKPLRSPAFRTGLYLVLLGFLFQIVALHFGRVVTVQTIAVSAIVFLLIFASLLSDHKLARAEWIGSGLIMGGIIVFLLSVHPTDTGRTTEVDSFGWLVALSATLVIAMTAVMVAPSLEAQPAAMLLGAGSGIAVGVGSGMIAALGILWRDQGVGAMFTSWLLLGMLFVQGVRLFLLVRALQVGPVTASIGAFVIMSPLAAWVVGLTLLDEPLDTGPAFFIGVPIALVMMIPGILLLTRSRVVEEAYSLKGMNFQASW